MTGHESPKEVQHERLGFLLPLCVFLAIAATLIVYEHRVHLLGWLPYLFLLACPLMHLFMHRGHGGHGAEHEQHSPDARDRRGEEER